MKVRTAFGITYNYIEGYKEWEIDKSFIEFEQGNNGAHTRSRKAEPLIIHKSQILAIEN